MTFRHRFLSAYIIYVVVSVICIVVTIALFKSRTGLKSVFLYLLAVNITTLFMYGYDKFIASTSLLRIPELILHSLAVAGGSPAALISQKLFRHKTIKQPFRLILWLIIILQLAVVFYFLK